MRSCYAFCVGALLLAMTRVPCLAQEQIILFDSQGWNFEGQDGLTALKEELRERGLTVKTTSEVSGLPSPALSETLLSGVLAVVTDRRESYSSQEIEAVDRYVWSGGGLLCSTDSDVSPLFIPAANSLLAPCELQVSAEGEVGGSTFLCEHAVNVGIKSVVNDDGPIGISFRWGTALAKVGESVVAAVQEYGYGRVGVVDADVIYDGEGKNIGLGDNRAFATNLALWVAGMEVAKPVEQPQKPVEQPQKPVEQPQKPLSVAPEGKPVYCPVCGARLLQLEKEGTLTVLPPGQVEGSVYVFPEPMVATLKGDGRWAVYGMEIEMPSGVTIEASVLDERRDQMVEASAKCFSGVEAEDLSDASKVGALTRAIQGSIDQILGGGKVREVRLKPLFVARGS